MDDEERQSKLSAGKERLAAFQKRKKRKKSSKKTDSASSKSDSTSQSFAAVPDTHSGNVSPIPFDDALSTSLPATLYSDASEPQTASTVPFVPFNVNLLSGPPPTSTDLAPPTSTDPAPPTSTDPAPPPSTDPAPPPASSTDHHWALPANAVEQHLAEFEDWALSDTPPEPFSSGDLLLPDVSTAPPSRVQPDTSTTTGGDGFDALDPLENHLGNPSGSSTNSDDWAGPNTRQTPPSFSSEPQQDRPASNSNLNPQTSSGERIEQWSPSPPLSQVSGRPRSQVEQGAPPTGGSAGRHNTPSPPGGAAEAELQVRNESLQRGLDSLQNELKLANDVRLKLQNEMIAVQEREKAVQEQLNERDHKHAEHIARITEQLSRQQDSGLDPDEREAHNIKMIKDKLQEMHKAEVERARVKHESEKTKILQDCQSRLEKYRLDSEQQANATIREMHAQFMSSNQALLQQKTASDELSTQLAAKVDSMQSQIDGFQHDQASLKKHYESALETRIQEILKLQHESKELEKRSENWRLKSVDIEAKFEQEVAAWDQQNQENEEATQKMKSQFEEKIFQLTSDVEDYQFRLQTSEMDRERVIEETRERFGKELAQIKSQHTVEVEALNRQIQVAETTKQKVIEDTKKRFDEELRKLRNQHASEVDILEESLTESGSDKASLELAEQHMRSVQTQLDAYRTQERNFQSKISEMERAHATDMEQLQQQIEASKASEIGSLIEKYDSRITALQGRLEAGESDSHSQSQEAIETLSVQHQKELLEVQTSLHESHELALTSLRKELELVNFRQLEALHDEHTRELDTLRSELEQHWRAEVERSKEQLSRELLASQEVDTQRLEASHQQVLKELRHSHLTQSGGDSTEARLAAVTGELEELKAEKERAQKDLLSQLELVQRQLQESHKKLADSKAEFTRLEGERHKYFTEGKSLAVDLSIECSAHEQDKEALAATQQEVVQLKAKCAYLQSEVSELEVAEKTSLEQSQKILELMDQLAAKNVSLTDLKVQNDALNTEVFALTQQCQKHVSASNALKKQLESSWGANEELSLLKKQLSELAPLKEDYTRIRGEVVSLASALKSKDEETAIIQTKLDESTREVSEFEQLAVKYQKAAETSALDLEALKQELSVLTQLEGELKREGHEYRARLDAMASNEAENKQTIEQLHRTVKNLQSELQSSTNHVAKLRQDKLKLEQDLLDSQGILDELATDDPELQQSYDHLQQDFEHLQSEKTQLAVELGDVRKEQERVLNEQQSSWQEQAREQERIIQELRAQVSAKEEAFTEIQSEFGRQLSEAEQREKSLRDTLQQMRESQTQLGSVVGEKTALETNLSSARQVLTEKLQEKATLENELSFHRCELERRLVEKQRLEELLFEKSRFELELKNQKDQLKTELDTIDSKLKLKELEVERERSEWQEMVQAKDSALQSQGAEFQRETAWLHQDHTHQLQQLREDFTTQHSSDLAQLSSSLNREHDLRLSSLASSLEQRHKKELEALGEDLAAKHRQEEERLTEELDERKSREVATLREVLAREKEAEMAEQEARLRSQYEAGPSEEQTRIREQLAASQSDEGVEQRHVEPADGAQVSPQQLQIQLEQESHVRELDASCSDNDNGLGERSSAVEQSVQLELQKAREEFDQELAEKIAQKEMEISESYEARFSESRSEWEAGLALALEQCRSTLTAKHDHHVLDLKSQHSEEMKNALRACEVQIKELKTEHADSVARSLADQELRLKQQYEERIASIEQNDASKLMQEKELLENQIEILQLVIEGGRERDKALSEEVESLKHKRLELEQQNKELIDQSEQDLAVVEEEKQRSLDDLRKQLKAELGDIQSSQTSAMKLEYENDLAVLKNELENLQQKADEDRTALQANFQQDMNTKLLEKEAALNQELAKTQAEYQQKLDDINLARTEAENQLRGECDLKVNEVQLAAELKLKALEEAKMKLMEKHAKELQDLDLSESKRLLELKSEVIQAADATSVSFTQQLKQELEAQKEFLTQQHECELSLKEKQLRDEFAKEIEQIKEEFDRRHVEDLASVETEAALSSARTLEELRRQLTSENDHTLSQLKTSLETEHAREIEELQQRLETQLQEATTSDSQPELDAVKSEYETRLTELEGVMTSERKKQLSLLKEQYDSELEQKLEAFKAQLQGEHERHTEEVVARCRADKKLALEELAVELKALVEKKESEIAQHLTVIDVLRTQLSTEVEALKAEHAFAIEQLECTHTAEIDSLSAENQQTSDAKLEEMRGTLVQEHMKKFKEMTEKLSKVHESEVSALKQEVDSLAADHRGVLSRLEADMHARHQSELAGLTTEHEVKLGKLHAMYEDKLAEVKGQADARIAEVKGQVAAQQQGEQEHMESAVRLELSRLSQELEGKLAALRSESTQREAELSREVELHTQQNDQLKTLLRSRDQQVTELEQRHQDHVTRLEEGVAARLTQLEAGLSQAVSERELSERTVQQLKAELAGAVAAEEELKARSDELVRENAALVGRLSQLGAGLRQLQGGRERELQEDASSLSLLRQQLNTLHSEREVLQSTVETLHAALSGSLELAAIVDSVLAGQPVQGEGQLRDEGLSEEYLTPRKAESPSLASATTETDDTLDEGGMPTLPLPTSEPRPPPPPRHTSISSTADTSEWIELKQTASTETMDSGLASALLDTPSTPSHSVGMASHMTPPTASLSVYPLDTTTASLTETLPVADHTHLEGDHASMLSVSFLSPAHLRPDGDASLLDGGADLSIVPLDSTLTTLTPIPPPTTLTTLTPVPPPATLTPADATMEGEGRLSSPSEGGDTLAGSSQAADTPTCTPSQTQTQPAVVGASGGLVTAASLPALQHGLAHFHDSVCALVQHYLAASTQATERSRGAESQLREFQAELLAARARIQELSESLAQSSSAQQQQQQQSAGASVEDLQGLLEKFKSKVASLKNELLQAQSLLTEKEQQLSLIQSENQALCLQITEITSSLEKQKQELTDCRDQLERELRNSQRSCVDARQEGEALKEVNRELRSKQERLDVKMRTQEEEINELRHEFASQLKLKQDEIRELQDLRRQLASREEQEEALTLERDELSSRLSLAEHKLATYQAQPLEEYKTEVQRLAEREQDLLAELRRQADSYEVLAGRLAEEEAGGRGRSQQVSRLELARTQLQSELVQLREELLHRDTALQGALADKVPLEQRLSVASSELEVARERLAQLEAVRREGEGSLAELRREGEGALASVKGELDHCQQDNLTLTHKLSATELALQNLQERHTDLILENQELQQLSEGGEGSEDGEAGEAGEGVASLQAQAASLTEQLRATEEEHSAQLSTLRAELDETRAELKAKCEEVRGQVSELQREADHRSREMEELAWAHSAELQEISTEHVHKMRELELSQLEVLQRHQEELEARASAEAALLRLQHTEQLQQTMMAHQAEVEHIAAEHQQLLAAMQDVGGATDGAVWAGGDDPAAQALLQRIAELAPVLVSEAAEVNHLCKHTGQPAYQQGPPRRLAPSPLPAVVDSLRQLLSEMRTAQEALPGEDWRSGLLAAVAELMEQRHQPGWLPEQEIEEEEEGEEEGEGEEGTDGGSQRPPVRGSLLEQLRSADRASLLAEISQLRASLDSLNQQHQEQVSKLHSQLDQVRQENTQLRAELAGITEQLEQARQECRRVGAELAGTAEQLSRSEAEGAGLRAGLAEAGERLEQLELSVATATSTISSLQQELQASCSRGAKLKQAMTREQLALREERLRAGRLEQALSGKEGDLTTATDQLLQERVALARAQGELNALHSRLSKTQAQLELLQHQTTTSSRPGHTGGSLATDGDREEPGSTEDALRQQCQQLQSQLESARRSVQQSEQEREWSARRAEELSHSQSELRRALHQLQTTAATTHTQEEEKERETQRLRRELLEWKQLAESRALNPVYPPHPHTSTLPTGLQAGMVGERQDVHQQYQELCEVQARTARELQGREEELLRLHSLVGRMEQELARTRDALLGAGAAPSASSVDTLGAENSKQLAESRALNPVYPPHPHTSTLPPGLQAGVVGERQDVHQQYQELCEVQARTARELQGREEELLRLHSLVGRMEQELARTRDALLGAGAAPSAAPSASSVDTLWAENSKMARLCAQYRQAEIHRKALVFQKRYLQCQVDAFYQTQQAALALMADMGAPVEPAVVNPSHTSHSKAFARFKTVGRVVIATLRFQYMRRRKLQYLRSKISKLTQSGAGSVTVATDSRTYMSLQAKPSGQTKPDNAVHFGVQTHASTGYTPPSRDALPFPLQPLQYNGTGQHAAFTGGPLPRPSRPYPLTQAPAAAAASTGKRGEGEHATTSSQKPSKPLQSSSHGTKPKSGTKKSQISTKSSLKHHSTKASSSTVPSKSRPLPSQLTSKPSATAKDDPQLVAYIQGLERLQARLNKTKL